MQHKHNIKQEDFLQFMFAGNATFTFKSLLTDTHITYKCVQSLAVENRIAVYYLNGPDNYTNYHKLCYILVENGIPKLIELFNGQFNNKTKTLKSFEFVFRNLCIGILMNNLEIWHEGKCCCCGRKLTVPSSIENGIGPECIKKELNKFFSFVYKN